MNPINLSRRGVLGSLGGLILGLHLPGLAALPEARAAMPLEGGGGVDVTAWVRIAPDGQVTIRVGAAEMGQGIFTSLPMIVAEELDADWSMVTAESAPAHKDYRRESADLPVKVQLTGGSESIRGYYQILREAGATARRMLIEAAAEIWDVDPDDCDAAEGTVTCGDRSLGYGELAQAAADRRPPCRIALKDPADFTLLGTSPPRLDLPPKTDGTATFGIDVDEPDALSATVVPCPHYGGDLADLDDSAARAMPGVADVFWLAEERVVVVVADTFWRAKKAAGSLQITWTPGEGAGLDDAEIDRRLMEALDARKQIKAAKHGKKLKEHTLEAVYAVPYLEHAPLEPLNATAHVRADRCDVWSSTQNQQMTRGQAAKITGLSEAEVFVHTTFLGGGFGRRSETDFTNIAVRASMHTGGPVKVVWTREACFARGALRPAMRCRLRAKIDGGEIAGWQISLSGQNILARFAPGFLANSALGTAPAHGGLSDSPYAMPSHRVDYAPVELPITVGWWRSVEGTHNAFFRECFLDEIAEVVGKDPIALRRELLVDSPRELAVLELAVSNAGAVPDGQHRGVALFECFGSICAQVADVSVTDGAVRVHRVTAALDCGVVMHPDTVKAQVMSGVGMGLSAALYEGLSFTDGAAAQANFNTHPLLKLAEMPVVDVHLIDSDEPPGGVGEPGLAPINAAVCNAIFAATGTRIRTLPIGDQLAG